MLLAESNTTVAGQQHDLTQPVDFISNPEFESALPESMLTLPAGTSMYSDRDDMEQIDIDACGDFDLLHDMPLLSPAGETFLFRKMNYLKHQAEQVRQSAGRRMSAKCRAEVLALLDDAEAVRNHIVECNLRLVISLARKFTTAAADFDELMSEGNEILLKAISKFDFNRGFRFSTYATHSVQRHFFRYIKRGQRRRTMEVKTPVELLNEVPLGAEDEVIAEWVRQEQRMSMLITRMAERLDEREHTIVVSRFGLGNTTRKTLRDLAAELGLSKERVRQLQMSAVSKLRGLFDEIGAELVAT